MKTQITNPVQKVEKVAANQTEARDKLVAPFVMADRTKKDADEKRKDRMPAVLGMLKKAHADIYVSDKHGVKIEVRKDKQYRVMTGKTLREYTKLYDALKEMDEAHKAKCLKEGDYQYGDPYLRITQLKKSV